MREKKEREMIRRANSCSIVLVEWIDDRDEGEHPVHADDIPEVQRAVFRGYQFAAGSLWRGSEWLRSADETGRNNTHVLSLLTHREVYVCTYVHACVCTRASATGSRDRITEETTGRRKRGEGRREIYLPEFRRPPPMSLPRNAFRIQNLSRNMFLLRPSIRSSLLPSLLFHRWFRSSCIKRLQHLF